MIIGKNILMIFSHPDDEIIFGWPIMQNKNINKFYLCCSTDEFNKEREWCSKRKFSLIDVCNENNTKLWMISAPSEFYKLNTRREKGQPKTIEGDKTSTIRIFKEILKENIEKIIVENKIDYIFTHNIYGEYGHLDHIFVFDTVLKNVNIPIIYSDICLRTNWDDPQINKRIKNLYFSKCIGEYSMNEDFYEKNKKLYIKNNAWTWSREDQLNNHNKCKLFIIE